MVSIVPAYQINNVGGYDPEDSWSRDSTEGFITGATFSEHDDYDGVKVTGDGPWYAVVVGYQTGDTFGFDFAAKVVDAFDNFEDAEGLARLIDSLYSNSIYGQKRQYNFTFNDKEYYASWEGYFESLSSVGVYTVNKTFQRRY